VPILRLGLLLGKGRSAGLAGEVIERSVKALPGESRAHEHQDGANARAAL
jgi:hypothetical protein